MRILNIVLGIFVLYISLVIMMLISPFDKVLRKTLVESAEGLDVIGVFKYLLRWPR